MLREEIEFGDEVHDQLDAMQQGSGAAVSAAVAASGVVASRSAPRHPADVPLADSEAAGGFAPLEEPQSTAEEPQGEGTFALAQDAAQEAPPLHPQDSEVRSETAPAAAIPEAQAGHASMHGVQRRRQETLRVRRAPTHARLHRMRNDRSVGS